MEYTSGGLPIKSWTADIEEGAWAQIINLSHLPFAFHHIAVMPDVHKGYGMPIGGVLATKRAVVPNAVGVDKGCGMCAIKTPLTGLTRNQLEELKYKIEMTVPVGFSHHANPKYKDEMPAVNKDDNWCNGQPYQDRYPVLYKEWDSALCQLGTLGGGNHFIEIQMGDDGHIWIMIHSGSRNLGKKVCDFYNKKAQMLNEMWYSSVPKEQELAFLPIEIEEYRSYMREMEYCVDFALANRRAIMQAILEQFDRTIPGYKFKDLIDNMINIAHNYAKFEHHFGEDVIVHRKGATFAGEGQIGIIPGSQGTKSYIVRGKGNRDSFNSCSHGAGRKMGRNEAKRNLDLRKEVEFLESQGILHNMRSVQDLEEASSAYKDIDIVMKSQEDLVDILVELKPLAVIKG